MSEDRLVRRLAGPGMTTTDPIAAVSASTETLVTQLYEGLFTHPNGTLDPEPQLATEARIDGSTITCGLHSGVRFHDGSRFTAEDVVYSFERLAASPNARRSAYLLETLGVTHETSDGSYVPGTLGVTATDDHEVRIELSAPFHAATDVLAHPALSILPAGAVDDVPGYDGERSQETLVAEPVGTGPFRLTEFDPETAIEMRRFDDYHGPTPTVAGVRWEVYESPHGDQRYERELRGAFDMFGMPTDKYERDRASLSAPDEAGRRTGTYELASGERVNLLQVPTLNTYYLGFDTERVERPLRRAIAYALDREAAISEAFAGRVSPAYHVTPPAIYPGGPEAYDEHAREYPYDPGRSNLSAATDAARAVGYTRAEPAELTYLTYPNGSWVAVGEWLADRLAETPVSITVEEADVETVRSRAAAGETDLFVYGWLADWPAPDGMLSVVDPAQIADADGAAGYSRWGETAAAEQAREAWETIRAHAGPTTADREQREAAYVTAEEANWTDAALLPVYHHEYQIMWYDWLDPPLTGPLGAPRQRFDRYRFVGDRYTPPASTDD